MKFHEETPRRTPEDSKSIPKSNWQRNLAVGALAFSVLTGSCGAQSSEKDNVPDSATTESLTDNGQPSANENETKAPQQRGSMIIDESLEYKPEDYPADSNAFRLPTSLEECETLMTELREGASIYENFLRYLAGNLQLTQEAWYHVKSGMKFYCYHQGLEIACANDYEELTDPHIYISGCQEFWVEGDWYFSLMHIPLYEWGREVISHELLHAAESVMTAEEWQIVSELIVTAFVELDENEMQALELAGAFAAFTEYETDTGGETVGEGSIRIDFNDPAHMQELYALVGTFFRTLPADLEKHYGRYFVDRQAIVDIEWETLNVDHYMRSLSN